MSGLQRSHRLLVSLLVSVVITLIGVVPATLPATAQDIATRIHQLARQVYEENMEYGGYTYWVLGDLGDPANAQRPRGLNVGSRIPEFSFTEFDGRAKFSHEDSESAYILNFWASWCVPCRVEFPLFADGIADGDINVPVYFVNTGELTKSDARLFLLEYASGKLSIFSDPRSKFGKTVGINFIPVTVLVDAEGIIQALHPGGLSKLTLDFFALIAEHPGVSGFDRDNPDEVPVS